MWSSGSISTRTHVAVALDSVGRRLGEILIEATAAGYAEMLTWADELGPVIVTSPDELRAELKSLTDFRLMTTCASYESAGHLSDPSAAIRHVLSSLALRWLELHEEIKIHTPATSRTPQRLLHRSWSLSSGSGSTSPSSCSSQLATNSDRVRSEAAFAKLCGACPIPASSGKSKRHRLNPRREPTSKRRALPSRHRSDAVERTHDLQYGTTDSEGLSKRENPLSQALRCTRRLQAAPSSLYLFPRTPLRST